MGRFKVAAKANKEKLLDMANQVLQPPSGSEEMLHAAYQDMAAGNEVDPASLPLPSIYGHLQVIVPVVDGVLRGFQRNARKIGTMMNEALSTVSESSKIEEIKKIEQSLREIPFERYQERAVMAFKKGIPMDKYEDFIRNRIAPRYHVPLRHIEELCDSTFCDENQVSITEFCFNADAAQEGEMPNSFTFCKMATFRHHNDQMEEVVDLGYCFFNVGFDFGHTRQITEYMETSQEIVPKTFLFWTMGHDVRKITTKKQKEEYVKFQLNWRQKDEMREYFRYKAVSALSQDALQGGEEVELMHTHTGMSPVGDV